MTPKASALMPFAREDAARLAGVSTATVPYVINDVLPSVTHWRVQALIGPSHGSVSVHHALSEANSD